MSPDSRPFKNSNLFSNHYLEKLVKDSPEWQEEAGLAEAFARIKELYLRKARVLENYNESQLEENFIRPVLRLLGHCFGVQGKVLGKDRTPDYAFFPDRESLDEADARPGEDYYRRAVAVGDAKSWKISLDKSRKGQGSFEMLNPSFQIDVYLRDTPPKWGILTCGRLWRLYHEATSYKLDSYYEVDLPGLLNSGDLESFKYFYLFFRREAFGQVVDGGSFLDRVREGSVAYAQEIGEDLQENVYRAMKILAEGLLAEAGTDISSSEIKNENENDTNTAVQEVQENSLRLLYRLLFIFYAESRNLLDTNNRYYYELSLQRLKSEVADRLDRGLPLLSVSYSYWEGLKNLFSLINDGSESRRIPREEFYIPAYNGGLFDPEKNSFLEGKRIGDSFLARAIDLLARSSRSTMSGQDTGNTGKGKGFVDYSSLEIRHLGSIYEGILEYRLKVADREMAAVKEKGKELWLPLDEVGKRKILDRVQAGEIFLATDKGERKATGSYYTPDYIVKYIVKNTIEPVIQKKKEEWGGVAGSGYFADFILSIKVLDPAMGSGHFLVEATDQLARWLVQAWATARPEETDSKEIAEQDVHWARREVVRNCIYGVDLNPMAVELAKLSLWLTTVASNKPLSFLDHHLRCGNSLIGAELEKLTVLPGAKAEEQPPLWAFGLKSHTDSLLKRYSLMAALPDDNLQMVKWKEEQFRQIKDSELSRRLNELSNVWLSTFFGNQVSEDDYFELQNHLSPEKFPDWAGLREREWFAHAQALAGEKRFFHWELEFPEAFQGEGHGFDVVIGNPPYVRQEALGEFKRYFEQSFHVYHGVADLYVYFIELGSSLLRNGGQFSYITANKWIRANYGEPLRRWMKKQKIEDLVDFGDLPVFPEATTYPCILRLSSGIPNSSFQAAEIRTLDFKSLKEYASKHRFSVIQAELEDSGWSLATDSVRKLLEKLNLSGVILGEYAKGKISYGIKTGFNDAFVIDENTRNDLIREDPRSAEIIKPFLFGRDIKRYHPLESDQYLIFARHGIKIKNYTAIERHLLLFKERLTPKPKEWKEGAWCGRKPGAYDWYEIQDTIDYYEDFEKPKIIFPDISLRGNFALDDKGNYYSANTTYLIFSGEKYLLALLNSTLLTFYYKNLLSSYRGGYLIFFIQYLVQLPIRRISFTTPAPERARLGAELQQLYAEGRNAEILAQVEACLPKGEAGNFISEQERTDVVHDMLAFLAERMLEMNKEKQHEIKGFLGWLEGFVSAKVEDLTPKTKLHSYYEHDYESFLAVLKKNRKKLAVDPARREPAEALRSEFEGSVGKLTPLRERIRQTDELIDAVVYRLYGLTAEEIAIVEGKEIAK